MTLHSSPRVLIVDDDRAVCESLEAALHAASPESIVESVQSAGEAPGAAAALDADAVVLDLHMPGADPLAMIPAILAARPGVGVLVLSGLFSDDLLDRAVDAGALGFLVKEEAPGRIVEAILGAARGRAAFSRALLR